MITAVRQGPRDARAAARRLWGRLPFRRPLLELWRRAGAPPERLWRHLYFEGDFDVRLGGGAAFRMRHFGALVENELFWAGYGNGWEATSLRLWARLAPQARIIVDIGANTGVYALAAAALNPSARVFAFEPVPRIAHRLRHNVALNRLAIEVVEAGVSGRTGKATLHEPCTEHSYSASIEREMLSGHEGLRERLISVTRLDDFAARRHLPRLGLLKIDAEMHELPILDGLGERLLADRPAMLVEILTPAIAAGMMDRIAGLDYAIFRVVENRAVLPVADLSEADHNYLLCTSAFANAAGIAGGATHAALGLGQAF